MALNCFNPACNRELRYLRNGRIVRVIRGSNENPSLEHYWLCGQCYQRHDFDFPSDGSVALRTRSGKNDTDEFYLRDVLLPDRRSVHREED